jgi:drug/metabolite transporter (DMT)-like permease
MPERRPASPLLVWAALLIVYVVWGSTYLAIQSVVETLPPLMAGGVRFMTAGVILLAVLVLRGGRGILRLSRAEVGGPALVGLFLLLGGNGLVSIAEREVPSGLAALIIGTVPLWVVVIRAFGGERLPRVGIFGVLLGFAGVAVLIVPNGISGDVAIGGMFALVASAGLWATGSILSRRVALPRDPFLSSALQLVLGGASMIIVGAALGEAASFDPSRVTVQSLASLAYLVVFGSILAFSAYTWLLQNASVSRAATYAYVNPVVAVVLGAVIAQEEITLLLLVGAVMIITAVAFIIRGEPDRPEDAPDLDATAPGPAPAPPAIDASASAPGPTLRP